MKKIYKATYNKECCEKATEECGDIQIEGVQDIDYPECLVIHCRKCWNKNKKEESER